MVDNSIHSLVWRQVAYPPDLQDAAVQNVLQQAEALSADWAA
jgi:type I restriction enzyme R subunit